MTFIHQSLRTRVVFRPGAHQELGRELAKLGCRRPLLLSGHRTARSALYASVTDQLKGGDYLEFQGVPQHSSVAVVDEVAHYARVNGADAFVAIGGGSVCDTAKAAALLLAEGGPLEKHASRFEPPRRVITPDLFKLKLPIISVPMTASGAEVTPSVGVRTAEGTKLLFWDAQLASRVILLDSQANLEVPASVMLSTGMNGLAHCVEGLYSQGRSPISDVLALDGLVRFDRALRAVATAPGDLQARADLLLAAHLSGMVLATARSCLHHAICHILGASFNVPHGEVNAIVLPHAVRFNAPGAQAELAQAARALGLGANQEEAGEAVATWLFELQAATGVPNRLRDLGIAREALAEVAEKTLHERGLAYNPRQVTDAASIHNILLAAW